ncbi:peptide deformylase [Romeria aff. gracilis LEGE 07310]|uniref:Peptide deformylase n=1 Tax=Vasconcelosia minhoensis LEGE 07310 TaxID=915328 RepID=A0A8J7DAR4_9CYAN|nr:peptide deformylase [Romeria gracilis]MBE9076747.1 peptide deformylase [Romeria aff. gracilis LEGE 07310]
MTERSIIQLGDPQLRSHAQPVADFADPRIQLLIDDLIETAQAANGVGIAAPQVGESLRLFIVASRPNLRYPHAPSMAPTAMLNPQIIAHSDEAIEAWEGCLSVPDRRGQVRRYREIEVTYQDRWGKPQRQVLTDFVARIFQHEYDHLEGRVFVDRVEDPQTLLSEADYFAQAVGA